ncbi:hypothetical protein ABSA28_00668 [Candidatus Hepatincolaceae symbiont of Richtersius coronifer]
MNDSEKRKRFKEYLKDEPSLPEIIEDPYLERLKEHQIPNYLLDTYQWAYIKPKNIDFLDNVFIYHLILFGQGAKLMKTYLREIKPTDKVLQVAHVYGNLVKKIAAKVQAKGSLDLIDVVPYQLEKAKLKLKGFKNVDMWLQDAAVLYHRSYDFIGIYFLLHEVPDYVKKQIIENALQQIDENNAKVVFIDYHNPSFFNPIRPILSLVNLFLEPYSNALWEREIKNFTNKAHKYHWEKTTFFGSTYQKVVVSKKQ